MANYGINLTFMNNFFLLHKTKLVVYSESLKFFDVLNFDNNCYNYFL